MYNIYYESNSITLYQNIMASAQQWLENKEQFNTKKKRSRITKLNIRSGWNWEKLEGDLDLSDFYNLEMLYCCDNKLTNLNLSKCQQLKKLYCGSNQLTNLDLIGLKKLTEVKVDNNYLSSFDYSVFNPKNFTYLDIRNNNLNLQNLSVFSKFTDLKCLLIGNDKQEKIEQDIYNRWTGSLKPLHRLTDLKGLHVSNTDINSGCEYLPTSVKKVWYSSQEKPNSKVREISEQLWWIEKGFINGLQLKNWIDFGLQPSDYPFAVYLTNQGYQPQVNLDIDKLKIQYYIKSQKSQTWLDEKYPLEIRDKVQEIYLSEASLEGELKLKGFDYERLKIYIYPQVNEDKLITQRQDTFPEIIKLINSHKYLQQKYPTKDQREKIIELDIWNKKLEGILDLSDFINLKWIDCRWNKLTSLNLSNCNQLEAIHSSNNLLTEIKLPTNLTKLRALTLSNNNFPEQDLSFLTGATNLKILEVGNWNVPNLQQRNRFCGSLYPLRNMTKLQDLDVSNTNIDDGLEYLSLNLKRLNYSAISYIISQQLDSCSLAVWRQINHKRIIETRISTVRHNTLGNLELALNLSTHSLLPELLDKALQVFIREEINRIRLEVTFETTNAFKAQIEQN